MKHDSADFGNKRRIVSCGIFLHPFYANIYVRKNGFWRPGILKSDYVRISLVFQIPIVQLKQIGVGTKNIVDLLLYNPLPFENLMNKILERCSVR